MRGLVVALVAIVAMTGAAMYGPAAAEAASVWGCSPVSSPNTGAGGTGLLWIYNGSVTTANVAAKWLSRTGANLAGVQVPGAAGGVVYPGQTGANTVPLAAGNTLMVEWSKPQTDATVSGNAVATIRVVSDVAIVVGMQNTFSAASLPVICAPLD